MAKRTITKWWMWGLVIMAVGGILALISSLVMVAHVQDVTAGGRYSFNSADNFFWTMIGLIVLGSIIAGCGYIAQFVAWIGALFNTHRLADKTWFRVLLWGGLAGYIVILVTLGGMFAGGILRWGGTPVLVWTGFPVGALLEWIVVVCYLVAGPDGTAVQQPQIATSAEPPKTLVPTG